MSTSPTPLRRRFDPFVDIDWGTQERDGLFLPAPPTLPEKFLPSGQDASGAFRPEKKPSTPEDLIKELRRMRRKMAPFLKKLAPTQPSTRQGRKLREFDWRLAEPEDWPNFPRVAAGRGKWKKITIPHYGEPLGPATAFYRTTFEVKAGEGGPHRALFCRFRGADYKAEVFINGCPVGGHEGFFAPFEFDITPFVRKGKNTLLVRLDNDYPCRSFKGKGDGNKIYAATGLGYDDPAIGWHHCPPGMGLYQDVLLEWRPTLHIADIYVRPLIERAECEAWIEVWNATDESQPLEIALSLHGENFRRSLFRGKTFGPVKDAGRGVSYYRLTFPLPNARLWFPESPWLYQLQAEARCSGLGTTDRQSRVFGMRSFAMDESPASQRGRLALNGREIRLRGANTMGFEQLDVFRGQLARLEDDMLLAKICGMNFIRFTQRPVQDEVYDVCDRLGLMTQTDLPLFGFLRRNQFCEGIRQAVEMERLIRGHACNVVVSYINEPVGPQWPDNSHRSLTRAELEQFFEAATIALKVHNPDRVVKTVDGDFNPPAPGLPDRHCYTFWYNGHGIDAGRLIRGYWQRVGRGWKYYACGEFGAEGLDRVELMRKHCPPEWLPRKGESEADWSPDRIAMAQTANLHRLWFDTRHTVKDWVTASREHQAWSVKLQTEIFRRDNRMNSFAIHLFIDAWPTGWMKTIMDVERVPKPAYFAYRSALAPLLASIRTDRWVFASGEEMLFEAWLCNDTHECPPDLRVHAQLEDGGDILSSSQAPAELAGCRATFQGYLRMTAPRVSERRELTLRLGILDARKRVLNSTSETITVIPPAALPGKTSLGIIGSSGENRAKKLIKELGLEHSVIRTPRDAAVILVEDYRSFDQQREKITFAVRKGARAIFFPLEPGEYSVGSTRVSVEKPGRGPRQFVSRATGHPLVAGFKEFDFRLWHDPDLGHIAPLMENLFFAEGWKPILLTAHPTVDGPREDALAAAEYREGEGSWIICQLALANRTRTNPAARHFAGRLLDPSFNEPYGQELAGRELRR